MRILYEDEIVWKCVKCDPDIRKKYESNGGDRAMLTRRLRCPVCEKNPDVIDARSWHIATIKE